MRMTQTQSRERERERRKKAISNIAVAASAAHTSSNSSALWLRSFHKTLRLFFFLSFFRVFVARRFLLFCFHPWLRRSNCARPLTAFNFLMVETAARMIETETRESESILWCCIRYRPSSIECVFIDFRLLNGYFLPALQLIDASALASFRFALVCIRRMCIAVWSDV